MLLTAATCTPYAEAQRSAGGLRFTVLLAARSFTTCSDRAPGPCGGTNTQLRPSALTRSSSQLAIHDDHLLQQPLVTFNALPDSQLHIRHLKQQSQP